MTTTRRLLFYTLLLAGMLLCLMSQTTPAAAAKASDDDVEDCGRRSLLSLKATCRKSVHCSTGYCGRGRCRTKKHNGHACYKNVGCKSGHCVSGKCKSSSSSVSGTSKSNSSSTKTAASYGSSSTSTSGTGAGDLLALHNAVRRNHQVGDLKWSDELASYAKSYASKCVFEHSKGKYGENLAYGGPASTSDQSLFNMWYDEGKNYDYSTKTFSYSAGHFTQVVWKDTKHLGCATVTCDQGKLEGGASSESTAKYLICEYSPPGNVEGGFTANVLPTK